MDINVFYLEEFRKQKEVWYTEIILSLGFAPDINTKIKLRIDEIYQIATEHATRPGGMNFFYRYCLEAYIDQMGKEIVLLEPSFQTKYTIKVK